jgi:putative endonuclease
MARHNETGKLGETLAKGWLTNRDYRIIETNWRYGKWEIDIIAFKNEKLHFFEVKTRRNSIFGHPEELVDKNKLRYFISAGTAYIRKHKGFRWIRFDILSITLSENDEPEFFLIEDVYF